MSPGSVGVRAMRRGLLLRRAMRRGLLLRRAMRCGLLLRRAMLRGLLLRGAMLRGLLLRGSMLRSLLRRTMLLRWRPAVSSLPRRAKLGRQLAPHVRLPDLPGVAPPRHERAIDPREVPENVLRVTEEEPLRAAVVRRRNDLREIDDRRSRGRPEHVVGGEISVDEIAREDSYELREHVVVPGVRLGGSEVRIDDALGRVPLGVEDELHQENSVQEEHWRRDADPFGVELVKGVCLG